jgi:peptidoglycan hydrolase-like protein with peptidoglycan-binding domain
MKKYLPILVLLIGLGVFIATATTPAFAATIEELQIQIQKLLEAIRSLQSQVPTTPPPPSNTCPFVSVMYLGYSKIPTNEVRELQKLLKQYPNIYPEGMVTGYFGKLTDAALRRFQQQYSLPTTGQTDTTTRAKLCELWQNKNQIGNCGWCGTACVRQTSGMYCPQVIPPLGVECKEVNGVCTKVPLVSPTTPPTTIATIKYSCMTVRGTIISNWYSTCIPDPNGSFNSLEECQKVCEATSSCTDSDGGKNYYVKGTVTYNGQTYTDSCTYCTGVAPYPVTCGAVVEYYCENGVMKQETHACENGYTCQDGACKPSVTTTTTVPSCTDSDGGMNPYEKGTVMYNNQIYTDTCSDPNTLIEYSCENGQIQKVVYPCEPNFTCQDGACKPSVTTTTTVPSCTDSDGGKNYYVKGTVTYNGQTYTDSCTYCTGVAPYPVTCGAVVEYYCENGVMKQETYVCENGYTCQDGACQSTVATTIPPIVTTIPSYGKCTDGSICGWCGDKCTKITAGMDCPQVAPPPGTNCTCINNTCTVQYSSSTLMDTLNKLTASLMSLMELLKH